MGWDLRIGQYSGKLRLRTENIRWLETIWKTIIIKTEERSNESTLRFSLLFKKQFCVIWEGLLAGFILNDYD